MINRFSGAIIALASVVFTTPLIASPSIDGQLIALSCGGNCKSACEAKGKVWTTKNWKYHSYCNSAGIKDKSNCSCQRKANCKTQIKGGKSCPWYWKTPDSTLNF